MSLDYVVCDVFTDRPLTGNQLAVFTDASDIDDSLLQALAPGGRLHAFERRPDFADQARRNVERWFGKPPDGFELHEGDVVDAGDVVPLTPEQIVVEVRLVTATLDGLGLQWLLDPTTNVGASVSTYLDRAIAAWRGQR